jgi:predicted NUDIX family phosphoesterase
METILCIKNSTIEQYIKSSYTSFIPLTRDVIYYDLLQQQNLWLGPRVSLEKDTTFRQIIPYVILKYKDKLVQYTRTKKGDESRLHNLLSLGIGGHINTTDIQHYIIKSLDIDIDATILKNIIREIQEEIDTDINYHTIKVLGLIYSTKTEVDSVHLGLAISIDLIIDSIQSASSHLETIKFVSKEDIERDYHAYEEWSKILWTEYISKQPSQLTLI